MVEDEDIAIVDANNGPWDGVVVVVVVVAVVKEGETDLFPLLEDRFGRNNGLTITGR